MLPKGIQSESNGLEQLADAFDHVLFGQRVLSLLDANQVVHHLQNLRLGLGKPLFERVLRPRRVTGKPKP